jgi:hypothetical protein
MLHANFPKTNYTSCIFITYNLLKININQLFGRFGAVFVRFTEREESSLAA